MSRPGQGWSGLSGSTSGTSSGTSSGPGCGGGGADSGRDTVFSSDGSSCCGEAEIGDRGCSGSSRGSGQGGGVSGASSGSSSSGVGSSHTPTATTPTTPTAPEPTRPPRITPFSGVLSQGKAVIRPVAFRPLQGAMSPGPPGGGSVGGSVGVGVGVGVGAGGRQGAGARLSNVGERYGSTPVLARPGTRLALHGSTTDLRSLHSGGASLASLSHLGGQLGQMGGGQLGQLGQLGGSLHTVHHAPLGPLAPMGGSTSHLSLDRKLTLCSSPPLSSLSSLNSLPLPGRLEGRGEGRYGSYDSNTLTAPSRAGSVDRNLGHSHSHRSDAALRRLPLVGLPLTAMHHGSVDRVDGDLDGSGLPPDLELEAALRGRDSELAVRQREERAERGGWARELRRLQRAADSRLRQRQQQQRQQVEHALAMQSQQQHHHQQQQQRHPPQQEQQQQQQQQQQQSHHRDARHSRTNHDLSAEVRLLRSRLEETSWALHQRNGELSLLKAQLKEALAYQEQAAQASRLAGRQAGRAQQEAAAMPAVRAENRDLQARLERADSERAALRRTLADRDAEQQRAGDARDAALRDAAELRAVARHLEAELELAVAKGNQAVSKHHAASAAGTAVQRVKSQPQPQLSVADTATSSEQVSSLSAELRRLRDELAQERVTWAEEKEKVLRYQRQLQLNYVQMFRRTRSLEAEVESLTMELELETKANKHNKTFAKGNAFALAKGKGLPLPELHAQAIEL